MQRRDFLLLAGGALAASAIAAPATERVRFKAIAFDAFPIFDPRPIAALAEANLPARGAVLMDAWRTRQFEYQWLRALGGQYADFLKTTDESLLFAAKQLQIEFSSDQYRQMVGAYSTLKPWPDVPETLQKLHDAGLRLVFLSNMTRAMLVNAIENAGLGRLFDAVISTDEIRSCKPNPVAYRMARERLDLRREEILFAAFAAWDVAGAKWFGYPTFWVNRSGSPMEELGAQPDGVGRDLDALVHFALGA
jgi:2-haloacid dehalogenase